MVTSSSESAQPLLSLLKNFTSQLVNDPYSAVVSNLLLVICALGIAGIGILVRWIITHPTKMHNLSMRIRESRQIKKFKKRYEKLFIFLVKRFKPGGAYGLSFTIGLALLTLSSWLFGSVLEDVIGQNESALFDVPIMNYIVTHRVEWLTHVMEYLTYLGNPWVVSSLAVVIGLLLRWRTKSWRPFILLVVTIAGAGLLDLLIKALVARARPELDWRLVAEWGYAFPSGHTAVAAFYGSLAYLVSKNHTTWRGKVMVWTAAVILIALIGFSRVYLGVHWPTDVLGGAALAAFWLSLLFTASTTITKIKAGEPLSVPFAIQPETTGLSTSTHHFTAKEDVQGLQEQEVAERQQKGLVNKLTPTTSRSVGGIFKSNIFTWFNALLGGLFLAVVLIGSSRDALFIILIILNTSIGIIQELRAKWTLDHLTVLTDPKVKALRAGKEIEIGAAEIVLDDVLQIEPGDQLTVDGKIISHNNLEINESLLTGEANSVAKKSGQEVLSGSFVVSGSARVRVIRVGDHSYAAALTKEAQKFSLAYSEIRYGINRLLKYITWALIPTTLFLTTTQLLYSPVGWRDAILSSVAGIGGMIPEGLVLLTSVVMAMALVRLAKKHALVQELPAVELLARVDVLCLDKTGTLTTGNMKVEEVIKVGAKAKQKLSTHTYLSESVLGIFSHSEPKPNSTLRAFAARFAQYIPKKYSVVEKVHFSSVQKWSALELEEHGSWVLGAPEIVLKDSVFFKKIQTTIAKHTGNGERVLVLAHTTTPLKQTARTKKLPTNLEPVVLVVLSDQLRKGLSKTLHYFKQQGVALKIISGDNPQTVSSIAEAVGLAGASSVTESSSLPKDIESLGKMVEDHTIFGRITPEQKKTMIQALRARGHVVAMVGDGINDVLAIKEADCGIALASGTAASRAVAQLVLVTNDFAVLPDVITEGRRVIANIERTAHLFLTKSVYVFALALIVAIAKVPFPFLPRHLTLIGFFTIAAPAFFLSLTPNTTRARPGFVSRVLKFAAPAGCLAAAATLIVYAITRQLDPTHINLARTVSTLTLIGCGLCVLLYLARKTFWIKPVSLFLVLLLGFVLNSKQLRMFFAFAPPTALLWAVLVSMVALYLGILRATLKVYKNNRQ
jgi:magnesium-transporting ATPase (P-type)/membrane-associated phospholipid phosphatase